MSNRKMKHQKKEQQSTQKEQLNKEPYTYDKKLYGPNRPAE
ncbi:hypothetical protein [Cytobacillus purgationiresistens]|uniref:Uncharacterized protein n=1 Tax=Cytobacillus purgationiresistens TaxID=863449 RepID=A0ABU0ABC0_9BACI|nr:hypothetical protein [Cytobacillus purgationiresistens]MDQ0268544.1 hypothetical protein [Cytobacillus purgationiresistens]